MILTTESKDFQFGPPLTDFLKLVCKFGTYYFVSGDGNVLLMNTSKLELSLSPAHSHFFLSTDPSDTLNFLVNESNSLVHSTAYLLFM